MPHISENLQQWVLEALELGYGSFCEGDHVPFAVILDDNGQSHLINFENASGAINSDLLSEARKIITETFPLAQYYALVWDGYLTTGETKQDAVFAEAGERGEAEAFIFAQQYKQKKRPKTLEKIDDLIVVATIEPLLK